jgi:hypothetical protein
MLVTGLITSCQVSLQGKIGPRSSRAAVIAWPRLCRRSVIFVLAWALVRPLGRPKAEVPPEETITAIAPANVK